MLKLTGAFALVLQVSLLYLTLQEMAEYAWLAYVFFMPSILYIFYTIIKK